MPKLKEITETKPEAAGKNGKPPADPAPVAAKLSKWKAPDLSKREVLYPKVEARLYKDGPGGYVRKDGTKGPLTLEEMKTIMGWESEPEYTDRMLKENPKMKPQAAMFGDDFLLVDEEGHKVICANNGKNRDYVDADARALAQDILNKKWRFNGEAGIIGRTGLTLSLQHRGIAMILAEQMRTGKNRAHWESLGWDKPITLEILLLFGVDETQELIQTLDNVRTRTDSDTIYTSEIFDKLAPLDRKECSKILGGALDLLWKRTGSAKHDQFHKFRTNSEGMEFISRHKHLIQCTNHLFEENGSKQLSVLGIAPAIGAACCYLMGCSDSDGEEYWNRQLPDEKKLDWERWDKAVAFWSEIAKGKKLQPVREAIKALVDEEGGTGRQIEKLVTLAKAWELYKDGKAITAELLEPARKEDGHLDEWPGFGGIDRGPAKPKAEKDPSEEEAEVEKARIRRENAEKAAAKISKLREQKGDAVTTGPTATLAEQLDAIKDKHPGKLLLFKRGADFAAWGADAQEVAKIVKVPLVLQSGLQVATVKGDKLAAAVASLKTGGYKPVICEQGAKEAIVKDVDQYIGKAVDNGKPTAAKPKPAAKPAVKK